MDFVISIFELFGIYAIMAVALNFQAGNVGVVYIGQMAYFAIGAYASALSTTVMQVPPLGGLLIGVAGSAIVADLAGKIFARLSGHYMLIASLGITELVRSLINNAAVTGGAQGLSVGGHLFGAFAVSFQLPFAILCVLLLELAFFIYLRTSPKGAWFAAVKEDEVLVLAMGKDPVSLKGQAMVITAIWSSIAGSLFAHYALYIDPTSFSINEGLLLYIALLIGGLGSLKGSFFASIVLIIIPVLLRFVPLPVTIISAAHQLFFALLLLFVLKFYPQGIFKNAYGNSTK